MNSALFRTLVVYGIVLPLAVIVGWMLSTPLHLESLSVIGGVIFVLLLPAVLKHHYAILIFSWNAFVNAFFLPGKPYFWTLMVVINITMMVMYRILQRRKLFISAPSLTFSIGFLTAVVVMTAQLRGGLGVRSLGSATYGGKYYFFTMMSLLGYFALASQPIDVRSVRRYINMHYLSGITAVVSNLIYFVPALYFLYEVFPSNFALGQYVAERTGAINRFSSFAIVGSAIVCALFARFGLRGVVAKPSRIAYFALAVVITAFGGFRSAIAFVVVLPVVLLVVEGLLFTRWTAIAILAGGLCFAAIVPFASKLPRPVQRVLSVTPVKIDPAVRADAEASVEWRLRMWAAVTPEMPKYFWLGKGYALNPTDLFLATEAMRRGYAPNYYGSMHVGDYHNGSLSVYMPFGAPGSLAFLIFLGTLGRALYLNFRYGLPEMQTWNRFLFAFFITKTLFFFAVFGSLHSDLATFTGIAGLTVALNRGICRYPRLSSTKTAAAEPPLGLAPSAA